MDKNGEYRIKDYDPDVIIKKDRPQKPKKGTGNINSEIKDEELIPPAPPVW